jgi:hypothetical protein
VPQPTWPFTLHAHLGLSAGVSARVQRDPGDKQHHLVCSSILTLLFSFASVYPVQPGLGTGPGLHSHRTEVTGQRPFPEFGSSVVHMPQPREVSVRHSPSLAAEEVGVPCPSLSDSSSRASRGHLQRLVASSSEQSAPGSLSVRDMCRSSLDSVLPCVSRFTSLSLHMHTQVHSLMYTHLLICTLTQHTSLAPALTHSLSTHSVTHSPLHTLTHLRTHLPLHTLTQHSLTQHTLTPAHTQHTLTHSCTHSVMQHEHTHSCIYIHTHSVMYITHPDIHTHIHSPCTHTLIHTCMHTHAHSRALSGMSGSSSQPEQQTGKTLTPLTEK